MAATSLSHFSTPSGYCVIISDILVGSAPRYEGVLPTLLGRHDGVWWLSRPAVLAALLGAVVVPTLVPRSLNAVARFSAFSVCMLFLLASAISGLAVAAIAEGAVAPSVHWLPDPGTMGGGTPLGALSSVLTVISGAWAGERVQRHRMGNSWQRAGVLHGGGQRRQSEAGAPGLPC